LALKGTGEESPSRPVAKKFESFSIRKVAGPLSYCSEIKPIGSKSGLCSATKACNGRTGDREPANHRANRCFTVLIGPKCWQLPNNR